MTDNALALSQKIANFMAKIEYDAQTITQRDGLVQHRFEEKTQTVSQYLNTLSDEIQRFKSIVMPIDQAASNWQNEINESERLYQEIRNKIAKQSEYLNRTSMTTIRNMSQLVVTVKRKQSDIQKLAQEKSLELQHNFDQNLKDIEKTVKKFQWKNFMMILVISITSAMIVSLFINNQWPWQMREQIAKQREVGKALWQTK